MGCRCLPVRIAPSTPLLFAMVLCFVACYFDGVMQVLTERRAQSVQNLPPLPDVFHDLLPRIRWWRINDLLLALFALSVTLRFAFDPLLRWKVLRRFLFLEAAILALRGVSVVLTTLSIPLRDCVSDATGPLFLESIYVFTYYHHTCADLLFSGHTATYVLFTLFWTHYSRGDEWQLCHVDCTSIWCGTPSTDEVGDPNTMHITALMVWAACIAALLVILASRFHYSCDVFIALCLTTLAFHLYHYYVKCCLGQVSYASKFIRWFEGLDRRSMGERHADTDAETEGECADEGIGRVRTMTYRISMLDGLSSVPLDSGEAALAVYEQRSHIVVAGEHEVDTEPAEGKASEAAWSAASSSGRERITDLLSNAVLPVAIHQ